MMRSSNSKTQGTIETINPDPPLENGLPPKEDQDDDETVRELAAQVVDDVVRRASVVAQERTTTTSNQSPIVKNRGCSLPRLPTIQIDTVSSPPLSPVDWTPPDESDEGPLDETEIQFELDTAEPEPDTSQEELREYLKTYIEDLLSQAMVVAEKKLHFAGVPEEDEEEDEEHLEPEPEPSQSPSALESAVEPEKEIDDSEIRAAAEKVVEEVISKATETVEERLQNGVAGLNFPGLPSFKIDTVNSAPPSPELDEESPPPQKKWSFKVDEKDYNKRKEIIHEPDEEIQPEESKHILITFDDAPEEVKEAAAAFVKEIVGKAVAMAEEKSVPTVPFNFEDVDMMKTNGPWYIRAREAFIRLLRTACFCTPRRTDS